MNRQKSTSAPGKHGLDVPPTPEAAAINKGPKNDRNDAVSASTAAPAERAAVVATAAAPTASSSAITENRKSTRNRQKVDLKRALEGSTSASCADAGISQQHLNAGHVWPPTPGKKKRKPSRLAGHAADIANVGTDSIASTAAAGPAATAPWTPARPTRSVLSNLTNTPSAPAGRVLAATAAPPTIAPLSEFVLPPGPGSDSVRLTAVTVSGTGDAAIISATFTRSNRRTRHKKKIDVSKTMYSKTNRDDLLRKIRARNELISDPRLLLSTEGEREDMIRTLVADDRLLATLATIADARRSNDEEDTENGGSALLNSPATARRTTGAAGGRAGGRLGLGLSKDDRQYGGIDGEGAIPAVPTSSTEGNGRPTRNRKKPESIIYDEAAADEAGKKRAATSAVAAKASTAMAESGSSYQVCCDDCGQWHAVPSHITQDKWEGRSFDCSKNFWGEDKVLCLPVKTKKAAQITMSNGVKFSITAQKARKGTAATTLAWNSVLVPFFEAALAANLSEDDMILTGTLRDELYAVAAKEMRVTKKQLHIDFPSESGSKLKGIAQNARAKAAVPKLMGDGKGVETTFAFRDNAAGRAAGYLDQGIGLPARVDSYDDFCGAIDVLRQNMDKPLSQKNRFKNLVKISRRKAVELVKQIFEERSDELIDTTGCYAFTASDMLKSVDELMTKVDRLVDERIRQEKVQPADAEEERKTRKATVLNAKSIFDGAVDLLVQGDAFVYEVDGKLRFFTMCPKLAEKHFCNGVLAKFFGTPEDFVRLFSTDGSYALCIFTGLILDTRARQSVHRIKDLDTDLNDYIATPLTGTKDHIRQIHVRKYTGPRDGASSGLVEWKCDLRGQDEKRVKLSLHQLLLVTSDYHGIGVRHHAECLQLLGTNDDGEQQTIDDVFGYTIASERNLEKKRPRPEGLNPHLAKSKQCDGDHLAGREFAWLNGILFVMLCSHRLNSCRSWVRMDACDWCFMFGELKYKGGSYVA